MHVPITTAQDLQKALETAVGHKLSKDLLKKDYKLLVDAFSEIIFNELTNENGEGQVALPKVGVLRQVSQGPRKYRNPMTGEPVERAACTVVRFKPRKALKEANSNIGK